MAHIDAARGRGAKAERTRSNILNAAVEVIGDKGYANSTCDEIAARAGVSKGVLFYHFKNKAAIGTAILKGGLDDLADMLTSIGKSSANATESLHGMVEAFVGLVDANRSFTKFFLSEVWSEGREWHADAISGGARIRQVIAGQIERGQCEGVLRKDFDPTFAATAFEGMCLSLSLDWITEHPNLSRDDFLKQLIAFSRYGLDAAGADSGSASVAP